MPESWTTLAALIASACMAGAVNSLAGGGTLLTFPILIPVLGSAVLANGTSTAALLPGSLAGAWGYRRELKESGRWMLGLIPASLVGGWLGAFLVTQLPDSVFKAAIPWLILSASLLFLAQPLALKLIHRSGHVDKEEPKSHAGRAFVLLSLAQFAIAIYGGYFGAGIGILMLTALGFMNAGDIHHMNAIKTVLAGCINAASVIEFTRGKAIVWPVAGVMAAAAIVGGFLGAHYGRRLPRGVVRWFVIVVGFGLAAKYFFIG